MKTMKTNKTRSIRRVAIVGAVVAIVAAACSSGATTDDNGSVSAQTATPSPVVEPEPEPEPVVEPEPEPEPVVEPEPEPEPVVEPEPEPEPDSTIELVATTLDDLGIRTLVPRGWTGTPDGGFAGDDAALEFAVLPSVELPDLTAEGLELVDERSVAGRDWDLYTVVADGVAFDMAVTEVDSFSFLVALETVPDRAAGYRASVLMPALEAFETFEPEQVVVSLADQPDDGGDLAMLLDELIADTELPAVGVTVFDDDRVIEAAVSGVRRNGHPTPVEVDDQFSIGSNVKPMTATVVATLVDEGVLTWETTVADVYGDQLPGIDQGMRQVTVRQLLNHTAGLNDEQAGGSSEYLRGLDPTLSLTEQRRAVAEMILAQPEQHPAGQYAYSNMGYTILGDMLELVTGTTWEDLLQARVFDALGMESCGFYAPGTPGQVDQPWGHHARAEGEAMDPGDPDAELPHVMAPAGTVHCSMADWALFLQSQLRGFQGSTEEIISAAAFDAMKTPPAGSQYGFGWIAAEQTDGTKLLFNNGSNLTFTAEVWLLPGENRGLLTVTNLGIELAAGGMQAVAEAVFERYGTN